MSTIANYCLLVACALPIVCAGIAKSTGWGKPRREGGYDNREPRAWLAKQSGRAARANAAQLNSFEALPLFIAGALVAQSNGANQAWVDGLALAFIAARVAYIALYLADQQMLRSLVWALGFGLCAAMFFL
jgi:uncharacterized MAPEG superfamily protein